ncbi:hypothetical protein GOP47_0007528 [Adiantum capillus-veneris]|uniref:DUF6821 domain-containing protein n=1 Tax=Adiantum capillus-veneris TaxID=13818 RepID=A0A9D4V176_ADICA|nr:hypothetical protein GOP47_0007528 [Adiantum capillus-veneris]
MADHGDRTEKGIGASSPSPEAVVDGSGLEAVAAIDAACSPGGSLHDDYFVCPRDLSEHNVLPLSTVIADQQSEQEAHSSGISDGLVSLDEETEATANRDEYREDARPLSGSSYVGYDSYVLHDEDMHLNVDSKCHDDNPFFMLLDDDVIRFEHCKVDDANPVIHNRDMRELGDFLSAGNHLGNNDVARMDEDNMNHTNASITVVELMATGSNGHQLNILAATQDSESPSTVHGMEEDFTETHPTSTEGGSSPTASGGSLVNTRNSRHCKVFTCASWLWNQLCRWQAQLGYANTIWSIALAAAMMGIIALGRRWQCLQAQNYSLRSQLWVKEKRIMQLMFQLLQTKEALAKVRRVPVICVKPALQIPQD